MTNDAPAYVASPPTGPGPPVLLLHTWWGLNQPIKDLADRLAGDGFTVLAADLFEGTVLTTIEDAEAHGHKSLRSFPSTATSSKGPRVLPTSAISPRTTSSSTPGPNCRPLPIAARP